MPSTIEGEFAALTAPPDDRARREAVIKLLKNLAQIRERIRLDQALATGPNYSTD